MDWLYKLCRWALGLVFIYAGGTKLLEPEIFAVLIEAYGIVPEGLLIPVAIGLPLLEVTQAMDRRRKGHVDNRHHALWGQLQKAACAGCRSVSLSHTRYEGMGYKKNAGKSVEEFQKLLEDDKDRLIVIYCGFVKCTRSHNGAAWAVKFGYKNVYRYPGGIFAWKGAGYPIEKTE